MKRLLLLALAILSAIKGSAAQDSAVQQSALHPCSAVPATPPDSLPHEYETLADTISGGGHFGGSVLRDIIVLQFRRGTSLPDKQAAVCRVQGVVVGGRPLATNEGVYLVRIPGDRTLPTLRRAVEQLRGLPHVLYAGPERIHTNLTPARTPPAGVR